MILFFYVIKFSILSIFKKKKREMEELTDKYEQEIIKVSIFFLSALSLNFVIITLFVTIKLKFILPDK